MSLSEIADNKWEREAVRPPTTTFAGICQILLIGVFTLIFLYILQGALTGIFGAKRDGGMTETYRNLSHEAAPRK